MRSLILACRTLEEELLGAIEETGCSFPVCWAASGLHNSPDLLRENIQSELNRFANVDRVLLLFGFCGNALVDITVPDYEMIFPRVDDCITLLLGSEARRKSLNNTVTSYFLTKGWLDHERNIWEEYKYSLKRFGAELGKEINAQILSSYTDLVLINTGCFDMKSVAKQTEQIASSMNLTHCVVNGTIDYIKKLLTGPHDESFVTVPPGHKITPHDLSSFKLTKS